MDDDELGRTGRDLAFSTERFAREHPEFLRALNAAMADLQLCAHGWERTGTITDEFGDEWPEYTCPSCGSLWLGNEPPPGAAVNY
jgi:hypothetical protein